ncbi:MAG TPA: glycosyltransferase family 39 protein [Blastocatellia bacterium]|nr:glycosyltransferase family 39 protein [Blastocatellia bacterium]
MKISLTRAEWVLVAILALALAPYFLRLGASSLWDANEAFYAETPREMIASGDLVNPTFNFRPRLNKPPLSYWIVVPFYKALGESEAGERLAIALGAMIMIATAYGLGRTMHSNGAGLLAALCLAIAPRFLMFSRRIMIDVYVSMFMALALLLFVLAEQRPGKRRLYLTLMYASAGLGVLTKGPVAVFLPAVVLIIYLIIRRQLNRLREMMLPTGLLIVALIVLPWYLAIYAQHGWTHIETFILKDNLSRFAAEAWGPRRGFFFYVPVVLGDLFPWALFLLPLIWIAISKLWSTRAEHAAENAARESRLSLLVVVWVVVIVAFFSFSKSKEDLYILPAYPAIAALIGGGLARFIRNEKSRSQGLMRWILFALALITAAAGALVLFLFAGEAQPYKFAGAGLIGAFAIVGGLAGASGALLNKTRMAVLTTAVTMIACNWVFVLATLPDFERYKPVRPLCEIVAAEATPDAMVGYYRTAYPSMVFYLRRPIFEYYDPGEIEAAFSSGKEVFCVLTENDFASLRARLPAETRVLASHPILQVKLKGIFDRVEPPRVLLISNKGGPSTNQ